MIGWVVTPDFAEAKRFGGGSSFGKMFSSPKKVAPAPKANTAKSSTTAAKPRSGMGGLMGGLLAGGLLGAMFMGGAFEGIQMMDILILAAVAFFAFKLFARSKPVPQQYAGHPAPDASEHPASFEPRSSGSWGGGSTSPELDLPAWFDKKAFLEGARGHFGQLQLAWNQNDLEEIRSYCSAELFASLEQERSRLGAAVLDNDLVSVIPELVGFAEQQGEAQLSIHFNGWMREGAGSETTEFNEIWHLTRDLSQTDSDWLIVGIEQVG
ncbi:MAG: Tim44-like domain-containing protein [Halopseudomonas sp.]